MQERVSVRCCSEVRSGPFLVPPSTSYLISHRHASGRGNHVAGDGHAAVMLTLDHFVDTESHINIQPREQEKLGTYHYCGGEGDSICPVQTLSLRPTSIRRGRPYRAQYRLNADEKAIAPRVHPTRNV